MRPGNEAELADVIQEARSPLQIYGGGSLGVHVPGGGHRLETGGLSGIRLYEPGALTLVAGAGTPLAHINEVLAEKGQHLPFEPMDPRRFMGSSGEPTIGGIVAANVSGPRRVQCGACRDYLLGVRFVDGSGTVVRNGGRVMKNVTGYDLVKLMAGSWGTLGVLSEVSLKVLARPEAEATLILKGQEAAEGIADLCQALGTPWDVSGAAWLGPGVAGDMPERRIRVEGLAGSVAYRVARLAERLRGEHSVVEGSESAALWEGLRDVLPFAGRIEPVWRISLRPTDAPVFLMGLTEVGVPHRAFCDWGGGLVWLMVLEQDPHSAEIREAVRALGGHATLIRATPEQRAGVPMFHPQATGVARLSAGLRARFDPRGILNPGLMGPGAIPA